MTQHGYGLWWVGYAWHQAAPKPCQNQSIEPDWLQIQSSVDSYRVPW